MIQFRLYILDRILPMWHNILLRVFIISETPMISASHLMSLISVISQRVKGLTRFLLYVYSLSLELECKLCDIIRPCKNPISHQTFLFFDSATIYDTYLPSLFCNGCEMVIFQLCKLLPHLSASIQIFRNNLRHFLKNMPGEILVVS